MASGAGRYGLDGLFTILMKHNQANCRISVIGPKPHTSGRRREHCSTDFAGSKMLINVQTAVVASISTIAQTVGSWVK
jgi:hypothetical protein